MRLATIANITLYGLQTIDGVAAAVGDRVLVKNQADPTQNGIYTASEGQWFRAADARTARTMQKGTTAHVQGGATNTGKTFVFQSINPRIGTDGIAVAFYQSDDTISEVNAAVVAGIASVEAASEDIIAEAKAARDAAIAAAAGVNLPPVTANTMLVDNAAGTAREAKTFAAVRTKLQSIPYSELPYVEAWNNGVPGDGSDQTAALQALINGFSSAGGNILLKGEVRFSTLNLQAKRHIRIAGLGGLTAGSTQQTYLRGTAGAGAGRLIDARDSFRVSFEHLFMEATNTANFDGILLDYGLVSTGSAYMQLSDCTIRADCTPSQHRGVNLYGALEGNYHCVSFQGRAINGLVSMQKVNGVGFCNVHNFQSCFFKNLVSNYPVQGSGEGITFQGCNTQACSDGLGRFWQTGLHQDFRGANILGCTFYDVMLNGGEWIEAYRGNALNVMGCRFGGRADLGYSAGIVLGGAATGEGNTGVHGVTIFGNNFEQCAPAVAFGGVIADNTHAKEIIVGGNHFTAANNSFFGSLVLAERATILPNNINGATGINANGGRLAFPGLPTAVTGLPSGALWNNTGVLNIAP